MLDDGLTVRQFHERTERLTLITRLAVLAESSVSTGGILRQFSITPKAIQDAYSDASKIIPAREDSTTVDFVKRAKRGLLRAVHFREDLLRNMINVLTQSVNRHIVLVGPDGVGKRTLGVQPGFTDGGGERARRACPTWCKLARRRCSMATRKPFAPV